MGMARGRLQENIRTLLGVSKTIPKILKAKRETSETLAKKGDVVDRTSPVDALVVLHRPFATECTH